MKRSIILALVLCLPSAANAGYISTFEDVGLPANSFNNNAGSSGFFVSGGNTFNNSFSPASFFGGTWHGWAMSSMTDTTTPGFTNQFSAITGSGANGSRTYGVAFTFDETGGSVNPFHPASSIVNLAAGTKPVSIQVTNTTYAYLSMLNGDQSAHKFGPGDFFRLSITGYSSLGGVGGNVGEVDYYLANFQGSNHYIVNTWQAVDLTSLAGAKSLRFGLESSDNDPVFGMNTPAYFAADNLTVTPEPSSLALLAAGGAGLGLQWLRKRRRAGPSLITCC
jgi:hypothetical protein